MPTVALLFEMVADTIAWMRGACNHAVCTGTMLLLPLLGAPYQVSTATVFEEIPWNQKFGNLGTLFGFQVSDWWQSSCLEAIKRSNVHEQSDFPSNISSLLSTFSPTVKNWQTHKESVMLTSNTLLNTIIRMQNKHWRKISHRQMRIAVQPFQNGCNDYSQKWNKRNGCKWI